MTCKIMLQNNNDDIDITLIGAGVKMGQHEISQVCILDFGNQHWHAKQTATTSPQV